MTDWGGADCQAVFYLMFVGLNPWIQTYATNISPKFRVLKKSLREWPEVFDGFEQRVFCKHIGIGLVDVGKDQLIDAPRHASERIEIPWVAEFIENKEQDVVRYVGKHV